MPNFVIVEYESNFNQMNIPLPDEKIQAMEGMRTSITYELKEGAQSPSELQVVRNVTQALGALGGKVVFEGTEHPETGGGRAATVKLNKNGREVWVVVSSYNNGSTYWLQILEIEGMKQEVAEGDLRQTLQQKGRVKVKVNFDTGKAVIRPESKAVLDEIAKMMADDPGLKLMIEGHTDNQGQPVANLKLSLARSEAVAEALIKRGVAVERLVVVGFG